MKSQILKFNCSAGALIVISKRSFKNSLFLFFLLSTIARAQNLDAQLIPSLYAEGYNINSRGAHTGSINLAISGGKAPYTFKWLDGVTSCNRTNLAAGYYRVIIADATNSTLTREITLKETEIPRDEINLNDKTSKNGIVTGVNDGNLLSSDADASLQTTYCGHVGTPVWNSIGAENMIYTCAPTKVGISAYTFPGGSVFHVNGKSLFNGDVEIGDELGSNNLSVFGKAKISSLGVIGNKSLVQADATGALSAVPFPTKTDLNYWTENAAGDLVRNTKVGIGINNPTHSLDVGGDMRILGFANQGTKLLQTDNNGVLELVTASTFTSLKPQLNYWELSANGADVFRLSGNVGIGTDAPKAQFQVGKAWGTRITMGDFWIGAPNYSAASYIGFNAARDESEPTTAKWKLKDGAGAVVIASTLGGDLRFFSLPGEGIANPLPERALTDNAILSNEKMLIRADGKVGVGNPLSYPGNYNLYVTGGILTDKVKVAANGSLEWMDKVFDKSYLLRSLNEVESFIADNKHLPEIPSTAEVQKNGIDLAVMDSKLLQKIEELTLYMIQLNKQNSSLQKRIQLLEAE